MNKYKGQKRKKLKKMLKKIQNIKKNNLPANKTSTIKTIKDVQKMIIVTKQNAKRKKI